MDLKRRVDSNIKKQIINMNVGNEKSGISEQSISSIAADDINNEYQVN